MQNDGGRRGRKRKPDADCEQERTLHAAFVQSANALSTLYSLSLVQQRKAQERGRRNALAATLEWVDREYVSRNVSEIPASALKAFLLQALSSGVAGSSHAVPSSAALASAGAAASHGPLPPTSLVAAHDVAGPAAAGGPTSLADPDADDDVIAIDMDQGGGAGRRTPIGGAHWIDWER